MKLNIFIAYASLLLLSSCFRPYYVAPAHNVPLFKEKHEIRASASVGITENAVSENIQLAYSATPHLAFIGTYMSASGGDEYKENAGKGRYLDLGGGYFTTIDKRGVLEFLAGFGRCNQSHTFNDLFFTSNGQTRAIGDAQLTFNKIFFQPSVGLTTNALDVAFTTMFSHIHFTNIRYTLDTLNYIEYARLNQISQYPNVVLFEPSLTIRAGWKYVKWQVQYTRGFTLSGPLLNPYVFMQGRYSIGFYFSLAPRYWAKKNETK